MIIKDERRARLQGHFTDFIRSKFGTPGGSGIERRGIYHVLDRHDLALHILRDQFEPIPRPCDKRFASDPKNFGVHPIRLGRARHLRGRRYARAR